MQGFRALVFVACITVVGTVPAHGQKAVLKLNPPTTEKAEYEHAFEFRFFSDRAEYVRKGSTGAGSVTAVFSGEWKSEEVVKPYESMADSVASPDTLAVYATLTEGSSRVVLDDEKLSYEKFPYTLDVLKDKTFRWLLSPDGNISNFEPDFRKWRLDRPDQITDLGQLWLPALQPHLPDHPVSEGDTWTGTRSFAINFSSMFLQRQQAIVELESTYELKKLKKEKDGYKAEIEEDRKITRIKSWFHIEEVSVILTGEGKGSAEWKIDTHRGVVTEHKLRMDVDRPDVTHLGEKEPLDDVRSEYQLIFERKLKDLKKL